MSTFSDYINTPLNGFLTVVASAWVQLTNNTTAVSYVSTGSSDPSTGKFTVNSIPPGTYTLATGPSNTGPWTATGDTNYIVAATPTDDVKVNSLLVAAGEPGIDTATAGVLELGGDNATTVEIGHGGVLIDSSGNVAGRSFTASPSPYAQSALAIALGASVSVIEGELWLPQPSGDTTGATDTPALHTAISAVSAYWASTLNAGNVAPQFAPPIKVHFWPGSYYLKRRVAGDQKSGGVFLRTGISLIGHATTLVMNDNASHIDSDAADISPLSATVATLTADVALGDYSVTVDSSAGFAVNSPVFGRFGDHPDSNAETNYWLYAYVAAIADGTHLTLDRPIGTALTVAGVTNAINKRITLMAYELRDFEIEGFTFLQGSAGGANVESPIRLHYCRDFSWTNLAGVDPGSGIVHSFCENWVGDGWEVPRSIKQLASAAKGRVLEVGSCVNAEFRNVHAANFANELMVCEFGSRKIVMKGVRAFVTNTPARTSTTSIFHINGGGELTVEDADIEGDGTNTTLDVVTGTAAGLTRYRNLRVNTSPALVSGASSYANIDGLLELAGTPTALNGRWVSVDRWGKRLGLIPSATITPVLPSGLIRRLLVYANSTTGITAFRVKQSATVSSNFNANLVAGSWVDITSLSSNTGRTWGTNNPIGNGGYTAMALSISTDGTLVAGTYLEIKVEYFNPATDDSSLAYLQDLSPLASSRVVFALTDAATVAVNAANGDYFAVSLTANRTMGLPTNPGVGQVKTFDLLNNTAGAITTTWNAIYKLAGAWVDPAAGKRRKITFTYDGTNWVEDTRTAADI